ncbi:hypothetical protein AcV5_000357 [Taiwanofungus camphoratus]|nr:hypothetical protein AcV7_003549 [Antrodia cinnamomea]KAI0938746.1 hypothetical protein AcV5_000357 [Antrodia cinnamomea]
MSADSITSQRHNDYVGSNASAGRIPGANDAATGNDYVAVFPKEDGARRAQEQLPPPTGRDRPPAADVPPVGGNIRQVIPGGEHTPFTTAPSSAHGASEDQQTAANTERYTTQVSRTIGEPMPQAPAPDSRTVIDRSPFATPASAGDTLTGATSQDVYGGLGHPGSGMTSAEVHHDGRGHRKRQGQGVSTYGSGEIPRDIGTEAK